MKIWLSLLILQNISQLRQHNYSPLCLLVQKSIKNPLMIPSFSLPFTSSILLPSCREHTRIILIVFSVKQMHIAEEAYPIQTAANGHKFQRAFPSVLINRSFYTFTRSYKQACVPKASLAPGYARYFRQSGLGKAWCIQGSCIYGIQLHT